MPNPPPPPPPIHPDPPDLNFQTQATILALSTAVDWNFERPLAGTMTPRPAPHPSWQCLPQLHSGAPLIPPAHADVPATKHKPEVAFGASGRCGLFAAWRIEGGSADSEPAAPRRSR
jgi:hypothetical protein